MRSQTADRESEDGGEDAGFEKEDEREHSDAAFATDTHRRGDEDHDARHEDHEDPAGLDNHHGARCSEATDCEKALADGVTV